MAMRSSSKGGHDFEFVSPPPSNLECSICLLTLKNPTVISCCGNQFCEPCIAKVKGDNKPCPLCNDPDYSIMLHKGVMREVNALTVYCPQKYLGCDWTGDLGKVDCHENIGSRDSGCGYVEMDCANKCGVKVQRKNLRQHENKVCPKKPALFLDSNVLQVVNTKLCSALQTVAQLKKEVNNVTNEKRKLEASISAMQVRQQDLQTRTTSLELSVEQMRAKIDEAGREKVEMKERILRLEGLAQKVLKLEKRQNADFLLLEKTRSENEKSVDKAKYDLSVLESRFTPSLPYYFTLHNLQHYKDNNFHWQSEPFYAFPRGYKLVVSIYPNGISKGKGNYLSMYVSIVGGEYDDELRWPFKGTIYVQIYNNSTRIWQNGKAVEFEDMDAIGYTRKPEGCNSINPGLGFSQWFHLSEMLQDFCHKGMVRFRVKQVLASN